MAKKVILDAETMKRSITRISFELIEHHKDLSDLVLVGVKTRGVTLANRIQKRIHALENTKIDVIELDISNFRDDRPHTSEKLNFKVDITGKQVVIVDDVLYTGRSIRAALDAIMSVSRPQKIELAVLIDRGHRELPIRPDYIGKNVPTAQSESIIVEFIENDDIDAVSIER